MAIQWSGLGPELLLRLDRGSGQPLRSQLEAGLREAIRSGQLSGGERLPSSRELARELDVSRGLVQECYRQLLAEGYLTSQVGSATRVATGGHPAPPPQAPRPAPAPRLIADFRSGVPDLASFPRGDWVWATREACGSVPNPDLDYGDPRGSAVLRNVLAGYLRRVRAAAADPEHMIVSTGFAQGLSLVLRALAQAGVKCVAFEDPGYGSAAIDETIRAVTGIGLGVVSRARRRPGDRRHRARRERRPGRRRHSGPPVTHRGRARGRAAPRPGGLGPPPPRFIVEDDYDSEFRYDKEPVGVLQGLAPDRVFTVGTTSKALAPAVRLGWVVAPAALAGAVASEKEMSDRGTSTLDQLVLAALLESGRYDRHLRRMRTIYASRRATLIAALAQYAPGIRLTGLAAGFHAVAHLPASADEEAVAAAALKRQVGLYPMGGYRATGSTAPPQLVMGFGQVNERSINAGIAAVADLLS